MDAGMWPYMGTKPLTHGNLRITNRRLIRITNLKRSLRGKNPDSKDDADGVSWL